MMKHLRRYIRNTLLEAFNTPNPGNIHDRLAFIKAPHNERDGGFVYAILDPQLVDHALKNVEMRGIKHHADANAVVLQHSLVGMMRIDEMTFGRWWSRSDSIRYCCHGSGDIWRNNRRQAFSQTKG